MVQVLAYVQAAQTAFAVLTLCIAVLWIGKLQGQVEAASSRQAREALLAANPGDASALGVDRVAE